MNAIRSCEIIGVSWDQLRSDLIGLDYKEYFDNVGVDQIWLDKTRWNQMRSDGIELDDIIWWYQMFSDDIWDQKRSYEIKYNSMPSEYIRRNKMVLYYIK